MPLSRADPSHQERFKAVLVAFAVLFMKDPAKELDKPRVALYWRVLEAWDIEQIEAAGRKLLGEMHSFPKPVHFRKVLEKDARRRRDLKAAPVEGIYCEYCEDLGMGVWWRGERGEDPPRQLTIEQFRALEGRRRAPAVAHERIEKRPPRHAWKRCTCVAHNPNYQQHAKEQAVPYSSPADEYTYDPNKWEHGEATAALERYVPPEQRRMWS